MISKIPMRDARGAAIVEFALALPLLLSLLMGILCYGQYFWIAHSAQQIANDAARATIAGLTPSERLSLAQAALVQALPALPEIAPKQATVALDESAGMLTARVRIDARSVTLLRVGFIPLPDPVIERRAVVRLGGAT